MDKWHAVLFVLAAVLFLFLWIDWDQGHTNGNRR